MTSFERFSVLALLTLTFCLYGCTSGLTYSELQDRLPALKPNEGRVYFFNTDKGIETRVKVDGEYKGKFMWYKRFFYVDLPAGEHKFTSYRPFWRTDEITLTIQPGESYYLEAYTVGRQHRLILADPEVAANRIKSYEYIGK